MEKSLDKHSDPMEKGSISLETAMKELDSISAKDILGYADEHPEAQEIEGGDAKSLAIKLLEVFEIDNRDKPLNEATFREWLKEIASQKSQSYKGRPDRVINIKTLVGWVFYNQKRLGGGFRLEDIRKTAGIQRATEQDSPTLVDGSKQKKSKAKLSTSFDTDDIVMSIPDEVDPLIESFIPSYLPEFTDPLRGLYITREAGEALRNAINYDYVNNKKIYKQMKMSRNLRN